MRVPWMQISMEVIEQAAPDLSVMLDRDEAAVGWGVLHLFRWALGRCAENAPPSENDLVTGPAAARLIARAARHDGDPDDFVAACATVRPALLEIIPGGIRVRGLDRYDSAWVNGQPEKLQPAWRAYLKGTGPDPRLPHRTGTGPEPDRSPGCSDRNRTGTGPEPDRQIQIQLHRPAQETPPRARARNEGEGDGVQLAVDEAVTPLAEALADQPPTLRDRLDGVFERKRGAEYSWSNPDELALGKVLGNPDEEIVRRWGVGLDRTGYPSCNTIVDLVKHWNAYTGAGPAPPGAAKAPKTEKPDPNRKPGVVPNEF